jgi:hypothetical protein
MLINKRYVAKYQRIERAHFVTSLSKKFFLMSKQPKVGNKIKLVRDANIVGVVKYVVQL